MTHTDHMAALFSTEQDVFEQDYYAHMMGDNTDHTLIAKYEAILWQDDSQHPFTERMGNHRLPATFRNQPQRNRNRRDI